MRSFALISAFAAILPACATTDVRPFAAPSDFAAVLGSGWTGALTYRDYSPPHGDVTLPVTATITATDDGVCVAWSYPTEPHANASDRLSISSDGRELAGAPLVARSQRGDTLELTTRTAGQDDDRPATIEHIYSLAPKRFVVRKVVRFSDAAPIRRNEYMLTRGTPAIDSGRGSAAAAVSR